MTTDYITFSLEDMNTHLTERQVKRVVRLHNRVLRAVAENSKSDSSPKQPARDEETAAAANA
jgi:hypothetical protein|tara:strand:+ start:10473 stop:10658 length:186 start_codon:yes stop_codon:yes gene_type:complete